jgi:hypothetical protein
VARSSHDTTGPVAVGRCAVDGGAHDRTTGTAGDLGTDNHDGPAQHHSANNHHDTSGNDDDHDSCDDHDMRRQQRQRERKELQMSNQPSRTMKQRVRRAEAWAVSLPTQELKYGPTVEYAGKSG